uniref:Putative nucleic acid-binding, OB-fold protein n=1 Tax=Helianthus annuus TaxID=4232 RepID=A0A251UEK2_HELAN
MSPLRFSLIKNQALKTCFCDARVYTRNVSDCGSFVVVDDGGREQAIESGRKVACVVLQVLFHDQVRVLQKSPEWPDIFKSVTVDSSIGNSERTSSTTQENSELDSCDDDDDDGLPPLVANTNRRIRTELQSASESDSDVEDS